MKGFHHPNILSLHGVVVKEFVPLVVFEYMDKGDLKSYLVKNKRDQVSRRTQIQSRKLLTPKHSSWSFERRTYT